jgi:hypothetical protein
MTLQPLDLLIYEKNFVFFFISEGRKTGKNVPKLKTAPAMEQGKQECREEDQARLQLFSLITS